MKTKTKLVFSAMLVSILAWSNGFAGQSTGGYISHIAAVNGALLFQVTGGTESARPFCASSSRFAVSVKSGHYQAITTAFEMGTQVTLGQVSGLGTCKLWSNAEDVKWIEFNR